MIELILSGYFFIGAVYLFGKLDEGMDLSDTDLPTKIGSFLYLMTYWPLCLWSDFLAHHYPDDYE
jgi:hypothetical protein